MLNAVCLHRVYADINFSYNKVILDKAVYGNVKHT